MTDFRKLCAELLDKWDSALGMDDLCDMADVMDRLRAALSEPVVGPAAPSDEELLRTYGAAKREYCYVGPIEDRILRAIRAATVHGLRAVLSRWGTTPTPPDDGELPEEVATLIPWLLEEAAQAANAGRSTAADMLTLAAQLLGERGPTLTPIPVSERLPREGNFDGKTLLQVNCGNSGELEIALNPRRWTRAHHDAWHRHIPDVHKAFAALLDVAKQRTDPSATHCLPANALPLPAAPAMKS